MKLGQKSWARVLAATIVILALLVATLTTWFRLKHLADQPIYGVSFSKPYAEFLGLDWQQTLQAMVSDLGLKQLRLMSYWDEHEPEPDNYQFSDLDRQFEIAQNHGAQISLAIGSRQPRWPECRHPSWAVKLEQPEWRVELLEYISVVVNRYKNHPNLASWQLENEFFNTDFGLNCRDFDRQRLIMEIELVRQLDPKHPLIMNPGNQVTIPLRGPRPDIYGLTAYRRIYEARFLKRYITHPVPAWYQSFRAAVMEIIFRREVIIHELQAEPWTPGPLVDTSFEEQQKSLSLRQLASNLKFAHATGIKTMYLWGGEYWYWRKVKFNDPSFWDQIKSVVKAQTPANQTTTDFTLLY